LNLFYKLIVVSIEPNITALTFTSICWSICKSLFGYSFVDNTGRGVTSAPNPELTPTDNEKASILHTVQQLQKSSQHWERLLFTTGGAININLQKSHWYLTFWNKLEE